MTAARFAAGLDGVSFRFGNLKLLGGLYRGAGLGSRPTAILLHGLPGTEQNLDIAYRLREVGWNCLYFHYRGSWGSDGAFSLANMADDVQAAIGWVSSQPCVDSDRLAIVSFSIAVLPAALRGAFDRRVAAIVAISPIIEPSAFPFSLGLAEDLSTTLHGVDAGTLLKEWRELPSPRAALATFAPRPIALVAGGRDDVAPPSEYPSYLTDLDHVRIVVNDKADHLFSRTRPWLVETVVDWLDRHVGR
jgi:uncharacterized protein